MRASTHTLNQGKSHTVHFSGKMYFKWLIIADRESSWKLKQHSLA